MTTVIRQAIEKTEKDLLWVGPNGKIAQFVVLPRRFAEALLVEIQRLQRLAEEAKP
jgi:hypothetical protein